MGIKKVVVVFYKIQEFLLEFVDYRPLRLSRWSLALLLCFSNP